MTPPPTDLPSGDPEGGGPRIADRLASGATWIVAGRAIMLFAMVVNTIVLARLLDPADFGLVAIALVIATMADLATRLSLANALVQTRTVTPEHFDSAFTLNAIRGVLVGLFLMGMSVPVAALYDDARLVPLLVVVGVSIIVRGFANPRLAVFARELKFHQDFVRNAAERMTSVVVSILIAFVFRSYWALVIGNVAGIVVFVISSYVMIGYRPRFSFARVRELMSFSVWLFFGEALTAIITRIDELIVGYVLGKPTLGILTVANRLAQIPTRETALPIFQSAFPGFAKINYDKALLRAAYQRVQSLVLLLALPAGCGLAVVAEPFVLLFLGEQWTDAIVVIQMLSAMLALVTLGTCADPLAMAMGRTKASFQRKAVVLTIRLPLVVGGLYLGGLIGYLIGRFIAEIVAVALFMHLGYRLLNVSILEQLAINGRTFLASGVLVLAVVLVDQAFGSADGTFDLALLLACEVGAGAAAYGVTIFASWWIVGRPKGPETELVHVGGRLAGRLLGRVGRSPRRKAL